MLIVERFSFKGPIRVWWTRDNLYKMCPFPMVDWLTMARDSAFDPYLAQIEATPVAEYSGQH